jgi:hypothetical protein
MLLLNLLSSLLYWETVDQQEANSERAEEQGEGDSDTIRGVIRCLEGLLEPFVCSIGRPLKAMVWSFLARGQGLGLSWQGRQCCWT